MFSFLLFVIVIIYHSFAVKQLHAIFVSDYKAVSGQAVKRAVQRSAPDVEHLGNGTHILGHRQIIVAEGIKIERKSALGRPRGEEFDLSVQKAYSVRKEIDIVIKNGLVTLYKHTKPIIGDKSNGAMSPGGDPADELFLGRKNARNAEDITGRKSAQQHISVTVGRHGNGRAGKNDADAAKRGIGLANGFAGAKAAHSAGIARGYAGEQDFIASEKYSRIRDLFKIICFHNDLHSRVYQMRQI